MRHAVDIFNNSILPEVYLHHQGVKVDKPLASYMLPFAEKMMEDQRVLWKKEFGFKFTDSGVCLKKSFEQKKWAYKWKAPSLKTKKINADFSSAAMKSYNIPQEIKNAVLRYRKGQNLMNYYRTFSSAEDSFVYPEYETVRTGRFSSKNPNIQGISKESFKGSPRDCIVPLNNDCMFIAADYSQAEYRMFADYIGNKDLIKKLNEGEDYHDLTAKMVGIDRAQAKNVNFALIYGASDNKLASMIEGNKQDAALFRSKTINFLGDEAQKFINYYDRPMTITRWTGAKVRPESSHKNINYLIQGGIADVCRQALYECYVEFYDDNEVFPYIQIHDEIVFCVKKSKSNLSKFVIRLKEIMEGVYNSRNGIVLKVDVASTGVDNRASLDKNNFEELKC